MPTWPCRFSGPHEAARYMSDYAAQFSLLASVFPPADIHVVDGERMVRQPLEEIRWIEETNDGKLSNLVPFEAS